MGAQMAAYAWQDKAACRGADFRLFFGPDREPVRARTGRERRAKAVCAACPVRQPCLDHALSRPEGAGVWGGMNEEERGKWLVILRVRARDAAEAARESAA